MSFVFLSLLVWSDSVCWFWRFFCPLKVGCYHLVKEVLSLETSWIIRSETHRCLNKEKIYLILNLYINWTHKVNCSLTLENLSPWQYVCSWTTQKGGTFERCEKRVTCSRLIALVYVKTFVCIWTRKRRFRNHNTSPKFWLKISLNFTIIVFTVVYV